MKHYKPFNTCPYCGAKIIPSWKFCDSDECCEKEKERRQKVAHYVEKINNMPNTPFEKETIEMFEKSFKNGSWWEDANNNKYSPAHAIKSFLLSRLHTLSALYRKEIEEMTFKMDVKDYLPKLKAWQGGYDRPFDDGYAQAKKDIINEIIK